MAYTIDRVEDGGVVHVTLEGVLTKRDHDEFRAQVVAAINETGWSRVLIDARRADPKMSVADDFEFTKDHRALLPIQLRSAILHRPDEAGRYGFIENVAVNRGVNLRAFSDEAEARTWLGED